MNSLDIFGKFKDRQSASSVLGGFTSIVALVFVVVLIATHLSSMKSDNLHRELKIDFHKVDQHVRADLDIILFNAPCDIISLGYKDFLGEEVQDIHISKVYVDENGKSEGAPEYSWSKPVTVESLKELVKKWPGCRMRGTFNSIMKVKGILYASFAYHLNLYNDLVRAEGVKVNLDYQVYHLHFGSVENNQKIEQTLKPYHEEIHTELNPFLDEVPHKKGNFLAFMYIQAFPFEVIDDVRKQNFSSFQYSLIRNYKQLEAGATLEGPSVNFELEFLPVISVYHIKVVPRFKTLIGILGACGGLFSIFGILNSLLSGFSRRISGASELN